MLEFLIITTFTGGLCYITDHDSAALTLDSECLMVWVLVAILTPSMWCVPRVGFWPEAHWRVTKLYKSFLAIGHKYILHTKTFLTRNNFPLSNAYALARYVCLCRELTFFGRRHEYLGLSVVASGPRSRPPQDSVRPAPKCSGVFRRASGGGAVEDGGQSGGVSWPGAGWYSWLVWH